jgi:5'-nucleotidase
MPQVRAATPVVNRFVPGDIVRLLIPAAAAVAMMAGCQAQQKPAAQGTTPTVLDVSAPRAAHAPSVYAMPGAVPASYAAPSPAAASTGGPAYLPPGGSESSASFVADPSPVVPAVAPPSARPRPGKTDGKTYIVKQGDTLFHIAKAHYGSGAKWHQIVDANPGLTPANLKAGQKLLMP